jgi:RNA polymerase sigma factor (TIGR02999 family)
LLVNTQPPDKTGHRRPQACAFSAGGITLHADARGTGCEGRGRHTTQGAMARGEIESRAARAVRVERFVADNYDELRRIAHSRLFRSGQITLLQTTDLVNEAYVRLVNAASFDPHDRSYFLAYAARTIRSVIVDFVRSRGAQRHGGGAVHVTLVTELADEPAGEAAILAIDDALAELRELDGHLASVVEMRFFAGIPEEEIAQALGISERTVRRHWEKARRLLATMLAAD